MDHAEALKVLRPQWLSGDWAKSNGELLWAHSYTVWSVGRKLAGEVPSLDHDESELLEHALLVHDVGKRRPGCQSRLRADQGAGDHKLEFEELKAYYRDDLQGRFSLSDGQIRQILEIARTHHSVSRDDIRDQSFARSGMLGRLLITADWIGSMEGPDYETLSWLQNLFGGGVTPQCLSLAYFEFSRFPSPSSYAAVEVALRHYRDHGWSRLVVFPQGAVFLAPPGTKRPDRVALAHAIEEEIIGRSMELQKPAPTGYTGDFLTLLSAQYPETFLAAHRSTILERLGSVDRAVVFVKLARDILNVRYRIKDKDKKARGLLDLVDSANSTSGHPRAKLRYRELYRRPAPDKVNRDMLDPLFEEAKIQDLIPEGVTVPFEPATFMSKLKADQLLAILESLAVPRDSGDGASHLFRYIYASLLVEEDLDFAALAREIFDRYKTYKLTSDAEKGVCERCACPVASKMQPGLNFATSPQAFSQIKPKYQYRAVCPLCGYDNLVVRKDAASDTSWVYARIEAKVPDLAVNLQRLEDLVSRVVSGVSRPRRLLRLEEIPELSQLPFPARLRIPVSEEGREHTLAPRITLNERGLLLRLEKTGTSRGPKDLRAQFEPVYHVLNFLGFQVALGTEEQNGLFGESVVTTRTGYLRSLAVILLSQVLDKKSNKYVYASQLIDRSPSTALAYAAGDGRERFGLKQEFLGEFLKYLVQANPPAASRTGDVSMKTLLEHAALLAPSLVDVDDSVEDDALTLEDDADEPAERRLKRRGGIWSFCEHKSGVKLTKHSATKPISQALDELMLGRGVEFALNKFMQNVSVKIPADRTGELAAFMAQVRLVIEGAEEIRRKDITDFLRYKNGLLSAVYMFTRYPNLKAVLVSEKE